MNLKILKWPVLILYIFSGLLSQLHASPLISRTRNPKHAPEEKRVLSEIPVALMADRYWSPHTSSSLYRTGRSTLDALIDKAPPSWQNNVFKRYCFVLPNLIINQFLMLATHEINGHGYRHRQIDHDQAIKYKIDKFNVLTALLLVPITGACTIVEPPLSSTYSKHIDRLIRYGNDYEIMHIIGGIEASTIMANDIVFHQFKCRSLHYGMAHLFAMSFIDLIYYVLRANLSEKARSDPGNDMVNYVREINLRYDNHETIKVKSLLPIAFTRLLNPLFYISLASPYWYLLTNKKDCAIPHFKFGNIAYMPFVCGTLFPFGLSYHLNHYIGTKNRTLLIGTSIGRTPNKQDSATYGSFYAKTDSMFSYSIYQLDVEGHVWRQPPLYLDQYPGVERDFLVKDSSAHPAVETTTSWGGLFILKNRLWITKQLGIDLHAGYKGRGFVEGEHPEAGFILRGGVSWRFDKTV